jgi:hypothetical protein
MNIAKFFNFLLLGLIITFCILIYIKMHKYPNEVINKISNGTEIMDADLYSKQLLYLSIKDNNCKLDYSKLKNNPTEIIGSTFQSPVLILRYSAFNCNSCIDFCLSKLEQYFPNYKNDKHLMFIYSNYPKNYKTDFLQTLNLEKENLGLYTEDANLPFLFVLHKGIVNHVFVPDGKYPEHYDLYLKEIIKKYFNK